MQQPRPLDLDNLSVQSPYQYVIYEAYNERVVSQTAHPAEQVHLLDKEYTCKISSSRPNGKGNKAIPSDIFSGHTMYSSNNRSYRNNRAFNGAGKKNKNKRGRGRVIKSLKTEKTRSKPKTLIATSAQPRNQPSQDEVQPEHDGDQEMVDVQPSAAPASGGSQPEIRINNATEEEMMNENQAAHLEDGEMMVE